MLRQRGGGENKRRKKTDTEQMRKGLLAPCLDGLPPPLLKSLFEREARFEMTWTDDYSAFGTELIFSLGSFVIKLRTYFYTTGKQ